MTAKTSPTMFSRASTIPSEVNHLSLRCEFLVVFINCWHTVFVTSKACILRRTRVFLNHPARKLSSQLLVQEGWHTANAPLFGVCQECYLACDKFHQVDNLI